jgi:crotonobetainyl-CoA:carnitine CoA-transferase CaiB-like acyl-CoA transferase
MVSGKEPQRLGNGHPNIVPYDVFPVADGHIIIATGNDGQFRKLCEIIGAPDLAEAPAFASGKGRVINRLALTQALNRATQRFRRDDLLAALEAAAVPAGPINRISQVLEDAQVRARGLALDLDNPHAKGGHTPGLRSAIVIDGVAAASRRPAPLLGEHQDEVLADPNWGGSSA